MADDLAGGFFGFSLGLKLEGVGRKLTSGRVQQFLYASIMIRDCCLSLVHRKGVEIVEKVSYRPASRFGCRRPLLNHFTLEQTDDQQFLLAFDAEHFRELGSMINDVVRQLSSFSRSLAGLTT